MKKGRVAALTVLLLVIFIIDMTAIVWVAKFPIIIKTYGLVKASDIWIAYIKKNLFPFIEVIKNKDLRRFWLCIQPLIFIFIGSMIVNLKKNNNNIFGAPPASGGGQYGTSKWQTSSETDVTLTVWHTNEQLDKGGIVLGMIPIKKCIVTMLILIILNKKSQIKDREKVWLDTEDTHTLIIGTTRSGKSRREILPTIWSLSKSGESMILMDPKGELYEKTHSYLKKKGYEIVLLDFRNPLRGNRWNPMQKVNRCVSEGRIDLASEAAWDIAHTIVYQKPKSGGDPIWSDGEESVIASLILLVAMEAKEESEKHMTSVYNTLALLGTSYNEEELPLINKYMNNLPLDHPARAAYATAALAPGKTRGSFFTTVSADLRLFSDPSISAMTARQDYELGSVGEKKTAVYLVIPDEKKTRHPLASMYIDQSYQALVEIANKNDSRLPIRTNYLCDEFGNLPPIPDFDTKLTVAGGRGIRFTLAIQDLAQLESKYGKSVAKTITGNCHTWVYILTSDPDTAEVISKKAGTYTIETESFSSQTRKNDTSSGSSKGYTGRRLITPDEVLRFPMDKSLVLRVRQYPALLNLPDLSKWKVPSREFKPIIDKKKYEIEKVSIWTPSVNSVNQENEGEQIENEDDDKVSSLDII